MLASDVVDAVFAKKNEDDMLNDHVLDSKKTLLVAAVTETLGSSSKMTSADIVDEDDDTSARSFHNGINIYCRSCVDV